MISSWPVYKEEWNFAREEAAIEIIKEAVRGIRNVRAEMNVSPGRKAAVYIVSANEEVRDTFTEGSLFFASLAYASQVTVQSDKTGIADDAVSVLLADASVYLPFADLVDIRQEIERLEKEKTRLTGELARSGQMLTNERFLSKAPATKIAEEQEKQKKYTQMMEQVENRLQQFQK